MPHGLADKIAGVTLIAWVTVVGSATSESSPEGATPPRRAPSEPRPADNTAWHTTAQYDIRVDAVTLRQSEFLQQLGIEPSADGLVTSVGPEDLEAIRAAGVDYRVLRGVNEATLIDLAEHDPGGSENGPVGNQTGSRSAGIIDLVTGTLNTFIEDDSWIGYKLRDPVAPQEAYVTNFEYRTRVSDNGDGDFYCSDYEIWLYSGDPAWDLLVYDNLGTDTDGGYDDDAENDDDIYLNFRNTHYFDGEDPNQWWGLRVLDNYTGDDGELNYIAFKVYWETPVAPPSTPTLTADATATSGEDYTVSWTESTDHTRYVLQESLSSDFASATNFVLSPAASSTTFNHAVVAPTDYYYRIVAENEDTGQSSDWSNTDSTVISPQGVPDIRVAPDSFSFSCASRRAAVTSVAGDSSLSGSMSVRSVPSALSVKEVATHEPVWVSDMLATPKAAKAIAAANGVEWCQTAVRYLQRHPRPRAFPTCPTEGNCDEPSVRDTWIPAPDALFLTVRLKFNVFREDDGTNPAASQANVDAQVATLNAAYLASRVRFVAQTEFIDSSQYRSMADAEETGMKTSHADDPAHQLNVYVVNAEAGYLGVATFPWDSDALADGGGLIVDDDWFGADQHTLTHEIGHCLGLWHTFHGVSEVVECSACYEQADGTDGDTTGDFAGDTVPTPRWYYVVDCSEAGGIDPCCGTVWEQDPQNYMSYAPDACYSEFSAQQWGRMRCWINAELTGWLEPTTPNNLMIYNDGTAELNAASISHPSWVNLDPPPPYVVPAGGLQTVDVTVDCGSCAGADLDDNLAIQSDDPNEPTTIVQVHVDCPWCGDGVCQPDETPCDCLEDCPGCCNDLDCNDGDICTTDECISYSCQYSPISPCCGDGTCEVTETVTECPDDCYCGNNSCDDGETSADCPQDCPPDCGNGSCDDGETPCTCSEDCSGCCTATDCDDQDICTTDACLGYECQLSPVVPCCGNGTCEPEEDYEHCPEDCESTCGNETCDVGEDSNGCPQDCYCGNGTCDPDENTCTCVEDCGTTCGDGCCNGNEDSCTCPEDCGEICGDTCCNGLEDSCTCWQDCETTCGDDCCNGSETCASCELDCGPCCLPFDLNYDGFVSIIGDVPLFVDCVYFGSCDCPGPGCVCPGDCNGDGFLSIIGDVPCFVDCVYFGDCGRGDDEES